MTMDKGISRPGECLPGKVVVDGLARGVLAADQAGPSPILLTVWMRERAIVIPGTRKQ